MLKDNRISEPNNFGHLIFNKCDGQHDCSCTYAQNEQPGLITRKYQKIQKKKKKKRETLYKVTGLPVFPGDAKVKNHRKG